MPLYAFRCPRCGHEFARLLSLRDAQSALRGPDCDSPVKRLITTFATTGACGSGAPLAPGGG